MLLNSQHLSNKIQSLIYMVLQLWGFVLIVFLARNTHIFHSDIIVTLTIFLSFFVNIFLYKNIIQEFEHYTLIGFIIILLETLLLFAL